MAATPTNMNLTQISVAHYLKPVEVIFLCLPFNVFKKEREREKKKTTYPDVFVMSFPVVFCDIYDFMCLSQHFYILLNMYT